MELLAIHGESTPSSPPGFISRTGTAVVVDVDVVEVVVVVVVEVVEVVKMVEVVDDCRNEGIV